MRQRFWLIRLAAGPEDEGQDHLLGRFNSRGTALDFRNEHRKQSQYYYTVESYIVVTSSKHI